MRRSHRCQGAIWKLLNAAGLGRTSLVINKQAVRQQLITQEELLYRIIVSYTTVISSNC